MKRTFLVLTLLVGLALGLSVAIGVAWHFMRKPKPDSAPVPNASSEIDPISAGTNDAGGAAGSPNVRAAKFAEHDTDQDGKLSLAEFSVGRKPAEAAKWFERRDANKDGFISREEFLPFSAFQKTP